MTDEICEYETAEAGVTQVHTPREALEIKTPRSLVAHLNGVQVVADSNPAGPTKTKLEPAVL